MADAETVSYMKLVESFEVAARSLLTSCPEEEFKEHFSNCKFEYIKKLYNLFSKVMAAVYRTSEVEFQIVCKDSKVKEELQYKDSLLRNLEAQNLEKSFFTSNDVRQNPALVIQKDRIELKLQEVNNMKLLLQKEQEMKAKTSQQLEVLRKEADMLKETRSFDSLATQLQRLIAEKAV